MGKADAWVYTPEGSARYKAKRAAAQRDANADGFDRGLERNDYARDYNVFRLPARQYRNGHELRCEVVSCEDLSRCQPGHGPVVKSAPVPARSARAVVKPPQAAIGYPPHDYTMHAYMTGAKVAKCWAPLLLPEQVGAVLVEVCVCGKDEAAHKAGKGCEVGYRAAAGCLYCPQHKLFLVADSERIERSRAASAADGFRSTATLASPSEKTRAPPIDPTKATLNLFPQHPEYHAKVSHGRSSRV